MKIPTIYLETTMFNFYFAEKRHQYFGKTVQYCQETKQFFDAVKEGKFDAYTSEYVIKEIKLEEDEEHRFEMLKLIDDYNVIILSNSKKIEYLANLYIEASAIPKTFPEDALHIASAVINDLDFIVSLNFQHIVKDKAKKITNQINIIEGYREVGILEPKEAVNYEDQRLHE
jgi:hypothetical protein